MSSSACPITVKRKGTALVVPSPREICSSKERDMAALGTVEKSNAKVSVCPNTSVAETERVWSPCSRFKGRILNGERQLISGRPLKLQVWLDTSFVVSQFRTELTTLHLTERRGGVVNGMVMSSVCPSNAVTLSNRVWSPGPNSRKFRRNDSVPTIVAERCLACSKSRGLAYMTVEEDHHRNRRWRS